MAGWGRGSKDIGPSLPTARCPASGALGFTPEAVMQNYCVVFFFFPNVQNMMPCSWYTAVTYPCPGTGAFNIDFGDELGLCSGFLFFSVALSQLPPPSLSLILPARCCKDQSPKKNAQFVMSCPAVNLPSVSHGEDLLSPIYLFATWTIEGPRPAEFSIIKPPTISPHPHPSPHPHVNNTSQPAGVTGH